MKKEIVAIIVLSILSACTPKTPPSSARAATIEQPKAEVPAQPKIAKIGEVVLAGSFAVTVNSETWKDRVIFGNQFLDLKPEAGIRFLIIDVTFKNTGTEPAMLSDGALYISNGTQTYTFGSSETILQNGWGLFLDNLNPLISKRTKLVYKISSEIKGTVSWLPADADTFIVLGNLQ